MNILVLNGSPKGKNSVTIQTLLYLEKRYKNHTFSFLEVGQKYRSYERDFSEVTEAFHKADLIIFSYPVYTFLAPFQLHRFIELMKQHHMSLQGKFATQFSTSKHFYDTTAHKYIEQNCYDLEAKYISGLSADMEDLLSTTGQEEACCFFDKLLFDIEHDIYKCEPSLPFVNEVVYTPNLPNKTITGNKDVLIVTNCASDDTNLQNMILDFKANCSHPVREINIREFNFSGGCLGCFHCSTTAKCIYKDGFDDHLRNNIQNADAIVYAYTIENHYTHSSFKCYDDRQFCNGHRSVTHGMPVAYIIRGDYAHEENVKTLVEARSDVGGVYLCGVANDQQNGVKSIENLTLSLEYALTHHMKKPMSFYGVGGSKIFRDLVYLMQGMMKADHQYYKKTGVYDFPQKQRGKIIQMKIIGSLMNMPSVQKKMKGNISQYIIMPYQKIINQED